MEQFPSNSRRPVAGSDKENTGVPEVKLEPVVISGKVIRRKKPLGRRIKDAFFSSDSSSVFGYIFKEVVIPAVQALATDMVTQGIEKAVYGEVRSHRGSTRSAGYRNTHISYDRPGTPAVHRPITSYNTASARRPAASQPSAFDLGEIIVEDKITADIIGEKLFETIERYNCVTVANLLELLDKTSTYTDNKYGWTNLDDMRVVRIREGYLLHLPDPEDLR